MRLHALARSDTHDQVGSEQLKSWGIRGRFVIALIKPQGGAALDLSALRKEGCLPALVQKSVLVDKVCGVEGTDLDEGEGAYHPKGSFLQDLIALVDFAKEVFVHDFELRL